MRKESEAVPVETKPYAKEMVVILVELTDTGKIGWVGRTTSIASEPVSIYSSGESIDADHACIFYKNLQFYITDDEHASIWDAIKRQQERELDDKAVSLLNDLRIIQKMEPLI